MVQVVDGCRTNDVLGPDFCDLQITLIGMQSSSVGDAHSDGSSVLNDDSQDSGIDQGFSAKCADNGGTPHRDLLCRPDTVASTVRIVCHRDTVG